VTEKVPEQSGKTDVSKDVREIGAALLSMGTRCWSGGGREALSWP